jgi:hypothetical protein
MHRPTPVPTAPTASPGLRAARRKFLHFFPKGFRDETYVAWERGYKWLAHERWLAGLDRARHRELLRAGRAREVAERAVRIESRTNLLFSFEKMALRDAVRTARGAATFAEGLYELLYGAGTLERRFTRWTEALDRLPRRQTRVLTWPLATVFGFLAQPDAHVFLKPNVTRTAAARLGLELSYRSRPSWETYASLLALAATVRRALRDMRPRDMIDVQSFLWVVGSAEYD